LGLPETTTKTLRREVSQKQPAKLALEYKPPIHKAAQIQEQKLLPEPGKITLPQKGRQIAQAPAGTKEVTERGFTFGEPQPLLPTGIQKQMQKAAKGKVYGDDLKILASKIRGETKKASGFSEYASETGKTIPEPKILSEDIGFKIQRKVIKHTDTLPGGKTITWETPPEDLPLIHIDRGEIKGLAREIVNKEISLIGEGAHKFSIFKQLIRDPQRLLERLDRKMGGRLVKKILNPLLEDTASMKESQHNIIKIVDAMENRSIAAAKTLKISQAEMNLRTIGYIEKTYTPASAEEAQALLKINNELRQLYNNLIENTNTVLKKSGHKPIPFREDYLPHIREIAAMEKIYGGIANVPKAEYEAWVTAKELPFAFKKKRMIASWFDADNLNPLIENPYEAARQYTTASLKVQYMTPHYDALRRLSVAVRNTKGTIKIPAKIDKATGRVITQKTYRQKSGSGDWIRDWAQDIMGMEKGFNNWWLTKMGEKVTNRGVKNVIVGSASVIMNQQAAIPQIAALTNMKSAGKGFVTALSDMVNKQPIISAGAKFPMRLLKKFKYMGIEKQELGEALSELATDSGVIRKWLFDRSKILRLRKFDNFEDIIKTGKIEKFAQSAIEEMDTTMVAAAYWAGVKTFVKNSGQPLGKIMESTTLRNQMMQFADDVAVHSQANLTRIFKPRILRTRLGRTLLPINTYVFNNNAVMFDDIPLMAAMTGKKGLSRRGVVASSIGRMMISSFLVNQAFKTVGMKPPIHYLFDYIPLISTARYGVSGAATYAYDIAKTATSDDSKEREYWIKRLLTDVGFNLIPSWGGATIKKITKYGTPFSLQQKDNKRPETTKFYKHPLRTTSRFLSNPIEGTKSLFGGVWERHKKAMEK